MKKLFAVLLALAMLLGLMSFSVAEEIDADLIAAAKEESFDCIVAQSICRFAQSSDECVKVVRDLHNHHTRVWFARERFWSSGFTAWLLWATLATSPSASSSVTSVLFRKGSSPLPL